MNSQQMPVQMIIKVKKVVYIIERKKINPEENKTLKRSPLIKNKEKAKIKEGKVHKIIDLEKLKKEIEINYEVNNN